VSSNAPNSNGKETPIGRNQGNASSTSRNSVSSKVSAGEKTSDSTRSKASVSSKISRVPVKNSASSRAKEADDTEDPVASDPVEPVPTERSQSNCTGRRNKSDSTARSNRSDRSKSSVSSKVPLVPVKKFTSSRAKDAEETEHTIASDPVKPFPTKRRQSNGTAQSNKSDRNKPSVSSEVSSVIQEIPVKKSASSRNKETERNSVTVDSAKGKENQTSSSGYYQVSNLTTKDDAHDVSETTEKSKTGAKSAWKAGQIKFGRGANAEKSASTSQRSAGRIKTNAAPKSKKKGYCVMGLAMLAVFAAAIGLTVRFGLKSETTQSSYLGYNRNEEAHPTWSPTTTSFPTTTTGSPTIAHPTYSPTSSIELEPVMAPGSSEPAMAPESSEEDIPCEGEPVRALLVKKKMHSNNLRGDDASSFKRKRLLKKLMSNERDVNVGRKRRHLSAESSKPGPESSEIKPESSSETKPDPCKPEERSRLDSLKSNQGATIRASHSSQIVRVLTTSTFLVVAVGFL